MASKLDPKSATQLQWFHALWQDEDDYDYDSCCGPEGVEKHGETDETHDFTSESVEKTTHLREELWDCLALGTSAPLRAGHEWKPPTDLVLPGAETGWALFPWQKKGWLGLGAAWNSQLSNSSSMMILDNVGSVLEPLEIPECSVDIKFIIYTEITNNHFRQLGSKARHGRQDGCGGDRGQFAEGSGDAVMHC